MHLVHRVPGGPQQHARRLGFGLAIGNQETWAGGGREGNAGLQFGIITPARAGERLRPAMIEDIFSIGMALEIKRQQRDGRIVPFEQKMQWTPAGLGGGRTGFFKRAKESMACERIGQCPCSPARQAVPDGSADLARRSAESRLRFCHATSKTASISTATLRGSEEVPTAALACRPASPNTSTKRSEAPLTTSGCCVNPGAALTKPVTLTTRLTRSRSPSSAMAACAMTLRPASRAARLASSRLISAPTIPTYSRPLAPKVIWPDMNRSAPVRTHGT